MTNSRIRTLAPGVDVERIAVESHFFYDPLTGVANVVFQGMEFLLLDGAVNKMLDGREPSPSLPMPSRLARLHPASWIL